MTRSALAAVLFTAIGLMPDHLGAQALWLEGAAAHVTWQPAGVTGSTLSGVTLAGAGGLALGPVSVEAGYAEGRMTSTTSATERPVLVEAFAALRVHPIGALSIGGGPYGRAYVTDAEIRRWLLWQIRGRYEIPLVGPRLTGYAELWSGFGGGGAADAPDAARGGGAGVMLALGPLAARLGYAIDDIRLGAGGGHETLERITLAVGIGRP